MGSYITQILSLFQSLMLSLSVNCKLCMQRFYILYRVSLNVVLMPVNTERIWIYNTESQFLMLKGVNF